MYYNLTSNLSNLNSKIETQVGNHRHISLPNPGLSNQIEWHKPMIFKDFRGLQGFGFR